MACIHPTLEGWVYIMPIHGSLYTRAQYTPTTPRSLNYRRSGVQDWTTRKPTICSKLYVLINGSGNRYMETEGEYFTLLLFYLNITSL